MTHHATVFEVSWEVCHRVGGIHEAVSTKARRMVERLGDAYVTVGPWMLSGEGVRDFEPDPEFGSFEQGCRDAGVPVRVGRWKVPGRPRTILVEFSGLYQRKDDLLAGLWDRHGVDSLFGDWDYIEPAIFGHAAGLVIERWWREAPQSAAGPSVAHFHEWMTGAGLLHLSDAVPEIGTVFTAHATVLGRALAATGVAPLDGLGDRTPEQAAEAANVRASHSLESAVVRAADVFTSVSDIAAAEARLFHGRDADPVLPNGWDAEVLRARVGDVSRADAARRLRDVASKFLGEDVSDAAVLLSTGRPEFRNKGFDLVLDAAADLAARGGPDARRIVVHLVVPAGNAGLRREVAERLREPFRAGPPLGVSTHTLFDEENDPIAAGCRQRGLTNAHGTRVRIVHVPQYAGPADGVFGMTLEALVQGADQTLFPSFYDAWGYGPQESLALGVPTVTTDCTGFGRLLRESGVPRGRGVTVLRRHGRAHDRVRAALVRSIERHLEGPRDDERWATSCREIAAPTEWAHLIDGYAAVHATASGIARERSRGRTSVEAPPVRALPPRAGASVSRPRVFPLEVTPVLPKALAGLRELAGNWRWSWDPEAALVLRELSPATWERVGHCATRILREAPQEDVDARAADLEWVARLDAAVARQREYLAPSGAEMTADGSTWLDPVAYVCAEYGIHESLPIYSGGLGALAGDHLRSASDLALPLVAVGLLYRRGYMRQRLDGGTEQSALDDPLDPAQSALVPVADADGRPVEVVLTLPATTLTLRAWRADVGRVSLYLLDSDVDGNRPEDRGITHHLYGGDSEARLRQEIVLGVGAVRLLAALGIRPSSWHVNEGHGAFALLERARSLMEGEALTFDEAREAVRGTTAFTTHTPVPAGHDRFGEDLIRRYFSDVSEWLRIPWERFLSLGASESDPTGFNMTRLAVGFATWTNGVSRLHGDVSRGLLRTFAPWLLEDEVPVTSVTNGIHVGAWTHVEIGRFVGGTDGLGPADVTGERLASAAGSADPALLWAARQRARRAFLEEVRARITRSAAARGDPPRLVERQLAGLDEGALLLCFARRFATYKRADLVLRDPARLRALLDAPGRPVRLFYAGKAHPRDAAARELLSRIAHVARSDEFAGRVFVLEGYDLGLARALVAGADVWMNTPRAPMEASGTSGMKAACNGALNLSVGDGWWPEAFDGTNGWRVGDEVVHPPPPIDPLHRGDAAQDEHDALALLALLEHEVVPLFFDRGPDGVPAGWMRRVARSMATIPPVFDTARMVGEYRDRVYRPLAARAATLRESSYATLRSLAQRRQRLHKGLESLRVVSATVSGAERARPGGVLLASLDVALGALSPGDVVVELVVGARDGAAEIRGPVRVPLAPAGPREGDLQRFEGSWTIPSAGSFGYGLRVRPLVGPEDDGPSFHDPVVWA